MAALQRAGLSVEIVSGDRPAVTEWAAQALAIDRASGNLSIEAKAELVRQLRERGLEPAFVGDGTNDALAMGEATASVAVGRPTDEALSASGFVLLGGRLAALPRLFAAGRKLRRVIVQNYLWAFAFNSLFVPVAAAGKLVPLAAVLLMLLSSSGVLLNSLRMRSGPPLAHRA